MRSRFLLKLLLIVLFVTVSGTKVSMAQNTVSQEIDSLQALIESTEDDSLELHWHIQSIRKWERINLDTALILSDQALEKSRQIKSEYFVAKSNQVKGIVLYRKGNIDEAIVYYDLARHTFEQLGYAAELSDIYNDLAFALRKKGEVAEALDYMQKSYEVRLKNDLHIKVIESLTNMAILHRSLNQYEKSIERLRSAELYDSTLYTYRQRSSLYSGFAGSYYFLNELDSVEKYTLKGLEIAQFNDDMGSIGRGYNMLGLVYKNRKDYQGAIDAYLKSVDIQMNNGDQQNLAIALNNLGRTYMLNGEYTEGIRYLSRVTDLNERSGNEELLEGNYFNLMIAHATNRDMDSVALYDAKYSEIRDDRFSQKVANQVAEWEVKLQVVEQENQILKERTNQQRLIILLLVAVLTVIGLIYLLILFARKRRQAQTSLQEKTEVLEERTVELQLESEKANRVFDEHHEVMIDMWESFLQMSRDSKFTQVDINKKADELFIRFENCYPEFENELKQTYSDWKISTLQMKLCKLYSLGWFDSQTIVATGITTSGGLKQIKSIIRNKLSATDEPDIQNKLKIYRRRVKTNQN